MSSNSRYISRFRTVALAEGVSWFILIGAMVMKYGMGMTTATKYPGWLHGVLFIAYIITAVPMFTKVKWPVERLYGVALAGLVPFGTFVLDRKWLR